MGLSQNKNCNDLPKLINKLIALIDMEKIYEYPNLGMDQNNELTNLNWPPPTLLTEAEDSIWISKDGEIERISHNNS